jgi:hypothetical protein
MNLLQRYEERNARSTAISFVGIENETLKPNFDDCGGNMGILAREIQHLVHAEIIRIKGATFKGQTG